MLILFNWQYRLFLILQEEENHLEKVARIQGEGKDVTTYDPDFEEDTTDAPEKSYDDPANWPDTISDNVRQVIVARGPVQVKDHDFPVNNSGRRFTTKNYLRTLKNGEIVQRRWLVYSTTHDAIYCFCCKLFNPTRETALTSSTGFSDWIHMSQLLSDHEKSPAHMNAFDSWVELNTRLKSGTTIDAENQRVIDSETRRWTEVLKRLIYAVQFLGSQNLAFRGETDSLFERNNGNFLKLVEFISKFDFVMDDHLRRVTDKKTHVHYLGKNIQNEIISILAASIKETILCELSKATYFSVILDCTPDVSHMEQMSLVVRFVTCQTGEKADIKEHFLGYVQVDETTGASLANVLVKQLEDLNIPLKNLRGQGYDNGSNMRGKYSGVQKRILDMNPRAFFVPCGAHTLNLVVNDAALCSTEAVSLFGIIQEVYNFFSASPHRWEILKKHVTDLTVKPLSETRWESRINAVVPLRYQLGEIYDALFECSQDQKRLDAFARNKASSLAEKLKNYQFICCLVTWHMILFRINLVSKKLQEVDFDISRALELISSTKDIFNEARSDAGFEKMLVDCREVAESIDVDVEPKFPEISQLRPRKKQKMFSYETDDERVLDPKAAFRSNFFFRVLDQTISSLSERFDQLNMYNQLFGFLHPRSIMSDGNNEYILKSSKDLQLALTDDQHSDVDGLQLFEEIKFVKDMIKKEKKHLIKTPVDILNFMTEFGLVENFPNLTIALRIMLTLPVSVATGERSFSKLKIIKNYLRSSMSQERLVGLAMMSIEFSVLEKINIDKIVSEFANRKSRKVHFLQS